MVCSTIFCWLASNERESSLYVTNTTYSGLQEHRIIVYTATVQKAKPKVHLTFISNVGLSHAKKDVAAQARLVDIVQARVKACRQLKSKKGLARQA
jgi:hypothetical protein